MKYRFENPSEAPLSIAMRPRKLLLPAHSTVEFELNDATAPSLLLRLQREYPFLKIAKLETPEAVRSIPAGSSAAPAAALPLEAFAAKVIKKEQGKKGTVNVFVEGMDAPLNVAADTDENVLSAAHQAYLAALAPSA